MACLKTKKHSPEILVTAGIVGVVASAVMACKATTKIDTVLEKSKRGVECIRRSTELGYVEGTNEPYSEEDSKKDIAIVYAKTGLNLAKLYAPSVALGGLSIVAILSSNNILRKRYSAAAAAYATVDACFKDYRKRVKERFGEGLDRELRYNIKAKEVEETVTDENGNETTVKRTVEYANLSQYDEYSRIYDDGCNGWTKDPEANKMFIMRQQHYANQKLQENGHLFLNEVYDMFGFPRTKAGQIVGWVYNTKGRQADGFVDFGLFDDALKNDAKKEFINGTERSVIINFNVDGPIYDLI
jgi:hypothetical protein